MSDSRYTESQVTVKSQSLFTSAPTLCKRNDASSAKNEHLNSFFIICKPLISSEEVILCDSNSIPLIVNEIVLNYKCLLTLREKCIKIITIKRVSFYINSI